MTFKNKVIEEKKIETDTDRNFFVAASCRLSRGFSETRYWLTMRGANVARLLYWWLCKIYGRWTCLSWPPNRDGRKESRMSIRIKMFWISGRQSCERKETLENSNWTSIRISKQIACFILKKLKITSANLLPTTRRSCPQIWFLEQTNERVLHFSVKYFWHEIWYLWFLCLSYNYAGKQRARNTRENELVE